MRRQRIEALEGTGTSSCFAAPSVLVDMQLPVEKMDVALRFRVDSGGAIVLRTVVKQAMLRSRA